MPANCHLSQLLNIATVREAVRFMCISCVFVSRILFDSFQPKEYIFIDRAKTEWIQLLKKIFF